MTGRGNPLAVLLCLLPLLVCAQKRASQAGLVYEGIMGEFALSYRNMSIDSLSRGDIGVGLILGGSDLTPSTFASSEKWRHVTVGAEILYHRPRWHVTSAQLYAKFSGVGVIGQDSIPGFGLEGSGNLVFLQLGGGAELRINSKMLVQLEVLPVFYWAQFTGELSILNTAPFRDRSDFAPISVAFRFTYSFTAIP